uniref:Uncharacterized protein n=1 Tax=Oryza punctata TaxID=4537 RepID=A0A0E0KVF0_ORYPU
MSLSHLCRFHVWVDRGRRRASLCVAFHVGILWNDGFMIPRLLSMAGTSHAGLILRPGMERVRF